MSSKSHKSISAYDNLYSLAFQRNELEYFLERLGLRYFKNNEPVVSESKIAFIKECIREDLGISRDLRLEIRWFDTGNAFALAKDSMNNHVIEIQLGSKNTVFQTGFNKKTYKFIGLYYNRQLVTEQLLKVLL